MKSKYIFYILFLFISIFKVSAQEYLAINTPVIEAVINKDKAEVVKISIEKKYKWEFLTVVPSMINQVVLEKSGSHDFGKRVACLKMLMNQFYITKEDAIAGDPMMRTIVLKPNVFYTVRKIEKHLKNGVKRGDINTLDAALTMEHVLEVALCVIDTDDSKSFELALNKNKKNIEDQISLFQQVKLDNIYK